MGCLALLSRHSVLVTLGEEEQQPTLKFWLLDRLDASGHPLCAKRLTPFSRAFPPSPVTCLAVLEDLSQCALGCVNGQVLLLDGALIKDRQPKASYLIRDIGPTITGLHYREDEAAAPTQANPFPLPTSPPSLFVCTADCLLSFHSKQPKAARIELDASTGWRRVLSQLTSDEAVRKLVVGRKEAVYTFDAEEQSEVFAFEGGKKLIGWHHHFLAIVTEGVKGRHHAQRALAQHTAAVSAAHSCSASAVLRCHRESSAPRTRGPQASSPLLCCPRQPLSPSTSATVAPCLVSLTSPSPCPVPLLCAGGGRSAEGDADAVRPEEQVHRLPGQVGPHRQHPPRLLLPLHAHTARRARCFQHRLCPPPLPTPVLLAPRTRLQHYVEKDLSSKVDILFKKNLYPIAISLALSSSSDPSLIVDIYQQYGDHAYAKVANPACTHIHTHTLCIRCLWPRLLGYSSGPPRSKGLPSSGGVEGAPPSQPIGPPSHRSHDTTVALAHCFLCRCLPPVTDAKGDYDQAIAQYIETIGYTEPSYVIRKFLDAQRIHNLTTYLQALHEKGRANSDHTTLLLNWSHHTLHTSRHAKRPHVNSRPSLLHHPLICCCAPPVACVARVSYTKLKEVDKLNEFVRSDVGWVFDVVTAINVCRQAGYFEHALYLAQKHGQHDLYIKVQLEDQQRLQGRPALHTTPALWQTRTASSPKYTPRHTPPLKTQYSAHTAAPLHAATT